MPTYIVYAAVGRLAPEQKDKIAAGITQAHSDATGAQGFFAQVIFNEVPKGSHYLGGTLLREDQVFVDGCIRGGRNSEQKRQLLESIVRVVMAAASTERRYVWAYVSDMPPSQMVEYGHVLPEPGTEDRWLASLPKEDQTFLSRIGQAERI